MEQFGGGKEAPGFGRGGRLSVLQDLVMGEVIIRKVLAEEEGLRLDRWFRLHYPALGHGQLQKLLRTGQVRLDGGRAKASMRLEEGQRIRIPPLHQGEKRKAPPPAAPAPPLTEKDARFVRSLIIYRDRAVIALNKPPGLAVQGGSRTDRHLDRMLDALRFEAVERPRLVHRLDKDTSGVLLLARSRQAAARLGRALKRREVEKLYWALVIGVPRLSSGEIRLPLVKRGGKGSERVHIARESEQDARPAITRYAVMGRAGTRLSWLAMWPLTGRTHQLRAHAAAIGHPIVGDGKYGGAQAHPGGEIPRMLHLHARRIQMPHPEGGMLDVQAPLPEHMRRTWELLGFDADEQYDPFAHTDKAG